jgi:hypothetical protein
VVESSPRNEIFAQEDAMTKPIEENPEPEEIKRRKKRGLDQKQEECREHASYEKNEPPGDRGACEKETTSQGSE